MISIILTIAVCCVIGLFIGWSGIAGFLLPIFYTGYLKLNINAALTMSFWCFLISGIIGTYNYHKRRIFTIKEVLPLVFGSLLGSVAGVYFNGFLEPDTATIILYIVVLVSGIIIFLKKDKESEGTIVLKTKAFLLIVIGIATSAICSFSGAGGPIIVMPLLVALGVGTRSAVGIALFDSIFIAVPAIAGYMSNISVKDYWSLFIICGVSHAVGIIIGSHSAEKIPQKFLKKAIAVFSIGISIYKFAMVLL